jgi:hypothetical protein
MKHCIWVIGVLFILGCQQHPPTTPIVAKVGDYTITKEEFDAAYKNSSYSTQDTLESRRTFLNLMINQKLILLDAQAKGLDKDKDFLKRVEYFWQQSLITAALQAKTREGTNLDQWVEFLKQSTPIQINGESLQ